MIPLMDCTIECKEHLPGIYYSLNGSNVVVKSTINAYRMFIRNKTITIYRILFSKKKKLIFFLHFTLTFQERQFVFDVEVLCEQHHSFNSNLSCYC